jgi:ABC-type glycerol-3-phosphate transport system substrate-binding protein
MVKYKSFMTLVMALPFLFLGSCELQSSNTAVLWTDRPEFALYAGYFNASQDIYKIETRYFESPSQKLTENGEARPDIVAGNWLKSVSIRSFFRPLDDLFKTGVSADAFYPRLLELGNIEGKQYLLPVAFNIPALVFARDKATLPSNPVTRGL